MKKLAALALLLFFFSEAASALPIKCNQFWPGYPDQDTNCDEWSDGGSPIVIDGVEMRLFHYFNGWRNNTDQVQVLATVGDVLRKAVPLFNQWFQSPAIYTTLLNEVATDGTFAEQTSIDPAANLPCRISIYLNTPNDRSLAEQVAAHEIFHCIQEHSLVFNTGYEQKGNLHSYDWWVEGSANFFAAFPFPSGGLDTQHGNTYNVLEALDRQTNPYSTVLFFDMLRQHMKYTYPQIGKLLKRQPKDSTFASERAALANWPNISEMLFQFARHFADQDITNVGGIPYQTAKHYYGDPIQITREEPRVILATTPFTIGDAYLLEIPAGMVFHVSLNEESVDNHIRVSYREVGTQEWREWTASGQTMETDPANAKSRIYQVLVTSTDSDEADQETEIQFDFVGAVDCFPQSEHQPPYLISSWDFLNFHDEEISTVNAAAVKTLCLDPKFRE